ncbi:phospholipase A2 inhibitor and Ly6/PLAUR domain-containing protein-like [Solea solea]|uniref:phospholipase A2 inhibitor and Ly6/PLAUR domain-containing protein-like n=1 Tax=Solea solea TaxID=90069 RepID=UPI00272B85B0|nr:phospholipase A2 inhibitor and Ly6/PLAUR domain-containing protein-like [Solea solea]
MMKLLLSLTLIWALSNTAGALDCETCTDQSCSSIMVQTCPSGTMCVTAAIQVIGTGGQYPQTVKACAPTSICPVTGNQTFSVNLGMTAALVSASCCNKDNCNSANLTYPVLPEANSLQCYTCQPMTFDCSVPTQCTGTQDHCIAVDVSIGSTTYPAYGCASANLLEAAGGLESLSTVMELNVNITSQPTSCNTTLCNKLPALNTTTVAPTATTDDACCIRLGMINLLIGLLIFTFY